MISPQVDELTGERGAVVSKQVFRGAPLAHQSVQDLDHVLALEPLADLDRQALATEDIDHRQCPELRAVAELVVHEVEARPAPQS